MPLLDFLAPAAVIPALRASSKKQALQELAEVAARLTGLEERTIYEVLLQRERLGSTGIGVAPQSLTASQVAMKVFDGTITSSPGPMP